jgi:glycosyltransferase involved in cell wall biosynthesis
MTGVAIVAERMLPERGGLARATARIAAMAAERGEEVHVVRLAAEGVPGMRYRREQQGVVVHEIGRLEREEDRLRAFTEHVVEVMDQAELDLVHGVYGHPAGFVAALAGGFAGRPSIVSLRGNDFDRGLFRATLPQLSLAVGRGTVVTAVTRGMARRAEASFGRPLRFVPNAVDATAFRRETADNSLRASLRLGDAAVIGFSGELREKKGLRFLLPAFAALARERDVRLLLIGGLRQDAEPAWEAFVRAEPEAAKRVLRLRYDDAPTRLSQRLALCDVMVFPSLYEGMPNAALEAMAAECCILATDVGGHGELIVHGTSGALLSLRDLDRLPDAIAEMLDLPADERRAMGRAARATVIEGHSPDAERDAWEAVYAEARAAAAAWPAVMP